MNNILIVEDSKLIAGAIKIVLEKEGFSVFYTANGLEVVDLIKKNNIDLVILDLMMPDVSGSDVLKLIKSSVDVKDTKVIILTAKTNARDWDESLNKCDKFMTKPFDNANLVGEVKLLLEK
ncbi:MAG: response regulator transcription factor [Candidatus Woesearchaeota archaeon]